MFASKKRHGARWVGVLMAISLIAAACAQAQPAATPTNLPVSTNLPAPATYTPVAAGATSVPTVAPTSAPAATAAPAAQVNAFGVTLPADAAPPAQQFIRLMANGHAAGAHQQEL